MQRFKKPFLWLALLSLVFTLLPAGLMPVAKAADWIAPSYFIPDDVSLQKTNSLDIRETDPSEPGYLSREAVKTVTTERLSVEGTFNQVTTNLEVTVQQLNSTKTGWVLNSANIVTDKLVDLGNNRFSVNLKLFPGYNQITFSGSNGNNKRTDKFYVLYDRAPTLLSAQITGSGPDPISLNEGSQAVVATSRILIEGNVENATEVSLTINGNTNDVKDATVIRETGKFFFNRLTLSPGLNTLKIEVRNETSKIETTRLVYFSDENDPFAELGLTSDGYTSPVDILKQQPTLSKGTAVAGLAGKLLLPYKAETFAGNSTLSVELDNGTVVPMTVTVTKEQVIPGADGVSPAYRLVEFKTTNTFALTAGRQGIEITVEYGADPDEIVDASKKASFEYWAGQTVINNMYLLDGFDGTDLDSANKIPLNNSQVGSNQFYVLVESDSNLADDPLDLEGTYLPLSTTNLTITRLTTRPDGLEDSEDIYLIEKFANGTQQVKFNFEGSTSTYNAKITYVSRNSIQVHNLIDGQTITINSAAGPSDRKVTIKGQYYGFGDVTNYQNKVIVNGLEQFPGNSGNWLDTTDGTFELEFNVDNDGPLYWGRNTIVLSGVTGGENPTVVTETLRFYIIDTNTSDIMKFIPVAAPSNNADRPDFPTGPFDQDDIDTIFMQATDFTPMTDGFVTGRASYDLVLHGGGAERLELYLGTESYFSMDIGNAAVYESNKTQGSLVYDFAGNQENFILRIRNIKFSSDGANAHTYNLDLINRTGSRTSQKLVVKREVSGLRIIAPQPTVEDKIIVNRNFVRFDIEAEGATGVTIGKEPAIKRAVDAGQPSRFIYDYVGLKKDKWNTIKITIDRNGVESEAEVEVYYASEVAVDSQFMAEKVSNKYSVFNKQLELTFPKGTVLQNELVLTNEVVKFYPDNKLLFGIADPNDGVVERRNDYGNIIFDPSSGEDSGYRDFNIPSYEVSMFRQGSDNFTLVSDIYWISGGMGAEGEYPSTNGVPPYSFWYSYPSTDSNQPVSFMGIDPTRRLVPSQRGELTIAYNPNVVDAAGTTLTVFRLNADGLWENIGGEVNSKSHTITVPFDEFGYYKVMKLRSSYKDITDHGWAREILNALYAKGIMMNNGLRSDRFGTDDNIKRGEFATLLVKGLNLPLNYDDNQTFGDVGPGAKTNTWSYEHIETAARAGIITGLGEGYFGKEDPLTREQAAVMVARAMQLKLSANDSKLEASLAKTFLDGYKIDVYARPAVQAVYKAKIMTGEPVNIEGQKKASYNFNPDSFMTRAEAGKIVVELLKKTTNIFPKNLS